MKDAVRKELRENLSSYYSEIKDTSDGLKINKSEINTADMAVLTQSGVRRNADVLIKRSGAGLVILITAKKSSKSITV